jgi:hypothetical protein
MVVRFVCVIRVPVCPECVPAPPGVFLPACKVPVGITGRRDVGCLHAVGPEALATRAAAAARVAKWRTVSIHSSASAV